jgi:hypothetical protein
MAPDCLAESFVLSMEGLRSLKEPGAPLREGSFAIGELFALAQHVPNTCLEVHGGWASFE